MKNNLETLFLPAQDTNSRWLMIVLHGMGDSIEGYRWLPEELRLPWLNYLLVNGPDACFSGYSWYELYGNQTFGIIRSSKLLTKLLDHQLAKQFPSEKTFLFGFSQGCVMTLETGLCYPKLLAGLIGISGYINDWEDLQHRISPIAKQQRILVTHGTLDPVLPFNRAKEQIQQLQANGYNIEWHEFPKEHTIIGEELNLIRDFIQKPYSEKQ